MKIIVPATTANLGPGFDSCGLALDHYLEVTVLGKSTHWLVDHPFGKEIPSDENNLLVRTALQVAPQLPPMHVKRISDIPLARGLGSSSSVIACGIELANQLSELQLTQTRKVELGTMLEGHPDNIVPAICGGFTVASFVDGVVNYVKHDFPLCEVIAFVPQNELLTIESRSVLPKSLLYSEAVQASAVANVMVAAIMAGDLHLAGKMMAKDQWHENYREKIVPHLTDLREIGTEIGAYATFLSGAGPTVITLVPKDKKTDMIEAMATFSSNADIYALSIDNHGIQVLESE